MSDDPNKRGKQDRERINQEQEYEVRDLAQLLNVSADQVLKAIKATNSNKRDDIIKYIQTHQ